MLTTVDQVTLQDISQMNSKLNQMSVLELQNYCLCLMLVDEPSIIDETLTRVVGTKVKWITREDLLKKAFEALDNRLEDMLESRKADLEEFYHPLPPILVMMPSPPSPDFTAIP